MLITAAPSPLGRFLLDPTGALQDLRQHVVMAAAAWAPVAVPALTVAVGFAVWGRYRWRRRLRRHLTADARLVSILPPPGADPAGATTLWANLLGLLRPAWRRYWTGQPHLAWEYVFDRETIRIRMWVPGVVPPGMVERAIEAAWPGARTRTAPAAVSWTAAALLETAGGELRLARSEALPIRTDFPADPIRALLGAPAGLGVTERAIVQVLARPVTGHRVKKARRAARHSRGGSPGPAGWLLDLLTPGPPRRSRPSVPPPDRRSALAASAEDRAVVAKERGASYETRVRYAISAAAPVALSPDKRAALRNNLRGRAHAMAAAFAVYTEHNHYRRGRLRHPELRIDERRLDHGDLLSIPELAALAHLPWDDAVPALQRAGARAVPPPPGVPTAGPDVRPIGVTDSGHSRPVGLRVPDARQHLHVLGATGSGKSELLARMILADAAAGRGLVVVDPKGDLITDILMRLPEEVGDKVILFDAGSKARPPVLNPLQGDDAAATVDNLVSIFSRVYSASWGPRTDDILRAGLLTLRALPGIPLLSDLPQLLTVPAFRQRATAQIHDDILRGFWTWYDDLSAPARSQVTAPLMNKLRGFLLRPFVRAALAGGPSTVNMDEVLDGGICLVRIAKDALGTETAHLMGSIVVAATWQAATRRAHIPQSRRHDAGLYLDEAHNFLNLPYALEDMLAEARAYRLAMTLAHQHLRQLPKELEEGVSTNARTKIFFNASPEDAHRLARHTEPRLTGHDLSNLDAFHAVVRPVLHGAEAPAFTAVTEMLPPPVPGRARRIRAAARRNALPAAGPAGQPAQSTADPRRTT